MTVVLTYFALFFYLRRVSLLHITIDTIGYFGLLLVLVLSGYSLGRSASRFLIGLLAALMCIAYLVLHCCNAILDVNLLLSFFFWLMIGISPALEEEPCNPLKPML